MAVVRSAAVMIRVVQLRFFGCPHAEQLWMLASQTLTLTWTCIKYDQLSVVVTALHPEQSRAADWHFGPVFIGLELRCVGCVTIKVRQNWVSNVLVFYPKYDICGIDSLFCNYFSILNSKTACPGRVTSQQSKLHCRLCICCWFICHWKCKQIKVRGSVLDVVL
jgi:hypothetical protein